MWGRGADGDFLAKCNNILFVKDRHLTPTHYYFRSCVEICFPLGEKKLHTMFIGTP